MLDNLAILLFFAILLMPLMLIVGFVIWLYGRYFADEFSHTQHWGKKIMFYALLGFLIGTGSCYSLLGLQSLFR